MKVRGVQTFSPELTKFGTFLDTYRNYDNILQETKEEADSCTSIELPIYTKKI